MAKQKKRFIIRTVTPEKKDLGSNTDSINVNDNVDDTCTPYREISTQEYFESGLDRIFGSDRDGLSKAEDILNGNDPTKEKTKDIINTMLKNNDIIKNNNRVNDSDDKSDNNLSPKKSEPEPEPEQDPSMPEPETKAEPETLKKKYEDSDIESILNGIETSLKSSESKGTNNGKDNSDKNDSDADGDINVNDLNDRIGHHQDAIKSSLVMLVITLDRITALEQRSDLTEANVKKLSELHNLLVKRVEALEKKSVEVDGRLNLLDDAVIELDKVQREAAKNNNKNSGSLTITIGALPTVNVNGVLPEEFESILKLAHARLPVMLTGPAGCGKTYISAKVAEALKLEYYSVSCTEGMSEAEFKGWLLPTGESGKFEYCPSDFVTAYEKGGIFCADEFDAIDPNCAIFVNKALSSDSFHLPQRKDNTLIKKHPDFVWIACCNTLGEGGDSLYLGRNQLDASTLDRHRTGTVNMAYSKKVEDALLSPDVKVWGDLVRESCKKVNIPRPCSTRFLLECTKMQSLYNWGPKEWETQFTKGLNPVLKEALISNVKSLLRGTK